MITVTRKFTFEAAHHLPDYEGKCKYHHGHSYKLFVEVSGGSSNKPPYPGMVCDFSDLRRVVEERVVGVLDHCDLNLYLPDNPTAENIVKWIVKELTKDFGEYLISVILYETENCSATWRKDPE